MLVFLDILLTILHSALILFALSGWYWTGSRKAHKWILATILIAWLLIGWWIGAIGYCPLTDWHWDIKRALGETGLPNSFTKYMIDHILGIDSNRTFVDWLTGVGLAFGVIMGIVMHFLPKK